MVVKSLKENSAGLLKIEKRTEILLLVTSGISFFFQVIQRKYILNNWKIDHLSPF